MVSASVLLSLPPKSTVIHFDLYDQCNYENLDTITLKEYKENPELLIQWEKNQLLDWKNFQGDTEEGHEAQACTYTWIFFNQEHEIVGSGDIPEFTYTTITATVYFRVFDSWAESYVFEKSDNEQSKILKHEQGHFDIAEEYARKFVIIAEKELMGKKFSINGTTTKEIKTNAQTEAKRILAEIWIEHKPEWNSVDKQYDDEVQNLFGFWNQWEYNDRFDKLRNDP